MPIFFVEKIEKFYSAKASLIFSTKNFSVFGYKAVKHLLDVGDKYAIGVPKIKKIRGRENISVGTSNVRTLRPAGKLEQLTHAMSRYHWNIVGLCEVCWKHFGEMSTKDGHKVYSSAEEDRHEYGVGFSCAQGCSGCCLRMSASLQQTDINPRASSSFQYHHHTGLCTNI